MATTAMTERPAIEMGAIEVEAHGLAAVLTRGPRGIADRLWIGPDDSGAGAVWSEFRSALAMIGEMVLEARYNRTLAGPQLWLADVQGNDIRQANFDIEGDPMPEGVAAVLSVTLEWRGGRWVGVGLAMRAMPCDRLDKLDDLPSALRLLARRLSAQLRGRGA